MSHPVAGRMLATTFRPSRAARRSTGRAAAAVRGSRGSGSTPPSSTVSAPSRAACATTVS